MIRSILAILAGLVAWAVVATLINFGLRAGLAGYAVAEPQMTFTLGMKVARLVLGALACLAAGTVAGLIAPAKRWVPWVLGIIVLAFFIPTHVYLWSKFPVWYHLTFLLTLVPLVVIGATLIRKRSSDRRPEQATRDRSQVA